MYVVTFTMMKKTILDSNYSMLLGCPWLQDAKVTHDWGNNLISIEGNGIICTIAVIKHLDNNTKCLAVLLCYDFVNIVTNEEEDLLVVESNLFITITLPKPEILVVVAADAKININTKISMDPKIKVKILLI
jgi:hypothetical protein